MSQARSNEDRLATLEAEVAQIKRQLGEERKAQNWLDHVVGSMSRHPEFQEVLRLGREFRRADRPGDHQ
ncbi:MAG TPA: hypothetical protein PLF81_06020 [Candidatus Anammoximicrobium sp.]|nr:hypothetical protein [Candidatus Anammoximicrobium sp.]